MFTQKLSLKNIFGSSKTLSKHAYQLCHTKCRSSTVKHLGDLKKKTIYYVNSPMINFPLQDVTMTLHFDNRFVDYPLRYLILL